MVRPILEQVAALTKRAQVCQPVVPRIAVEMCRRKHDTRHPELRGLHEVRPPGHTALAVSPGRRLLIEPSSVRQTADESEMWAPTTLAPAFGTLEADVAAQLMPVRWIERTQFGTNRQAAEGLSPYRISDDLAERGVKLSHVTVRKIIAASSRAAG